MKTKASSTSSIKGKLQFKSSFDSDVAIGAMVGGDNSGSSLYPITGSDYSGSNWPFLFKDRNADINRISNIINAPTTVLDMNDYFASSIETVVGRAGGNVNALRMELTQAAATQSQQWVFQQWNTPSIITDQPFYIKFWIKFPTDLADQIGLENFRSIFFYKTSGSEHRAEMNIITGATGVPQWYFIVDSYPTGEQVVHFQSSPGIPIPVDEWICVEWFVNRSQNSDGFIWYAINGLSDSYEGANYGPEDLNINRIGSVGIYQGTTGQYPAYHHISDIEVWSGFPNGWGVSTYP